MKHAHAHYGEQGFTLIEIIIVLVLLGILAATAVPKYFDLQTQARIQAANAAVAELQSRINLSFAQNLLKGQSCTEARTTALTDNPSNTDVGNGWKVAYTAGDKAATINSVTPPTGDKAGTITPTTISFELPVCDATKQTN